MARTKQSGPDLFDDIDDPGDLLDEPPDAPTAKVKGKLYADLRCAVCGADYTVQYLISKGVPERRCCQRFYCRCVTDWSDDEWRLRAESVGRRPPLRPWTKLRVELGRDAELDSRHLVATHPCQWCGAGSVIVALPPAFPVPGFGPGDRARACTGCGTIAAVWFAAPTDSDRVDAAALQRFPGAASQRFGPDTSPVAPGWPVDARGNPAAPLVPAVAPEPVQRPSGLRSNVQLVRSDVPWTPPQPEPERPRARLLDVLPSSAPRPAAAARKPVRARTAGAAPSSDVCQLVEQQGSKYRAKCGREAVAKTMPDARMTGFQGRVTCGACLAAAAGIR